ncbi:hypothetical protein DVJ78_18030 (plasmid) [Humibacter sp. BT305]|nr:hypothetical protein DVJ78_18030 [Humibacter sp. BT305]
MWVAIMVRAFMAAAGICLILVAANRLGGGVGDGGDWVLLLAGVGLLLSGALIGGIELWAWKRERDELDDVVARNAEHDGEHEGRR